MKTLLELYLKGDLLQKAVAALHAVRGPEAGAHGTAALCGALCAELGEYYDGESLLNAFYAARAKKDQLPARLIAFARRALPKVTPANCLVYNDLDDRLWVDIRDRTETVELPFVDGEDDPRERKPNGMRDYVAHFTFYTLYHESHGHCFIFFLRETTYTDEAGLRQVFGTNLHFRRHDQVTTEFRAQTAEELWKRFVLYGDTRDPGFTFSGYFAKDTTEAEADLWAHNMWTEIAHLETIH